MTENKEKIINAFNNAWNKVMTEEIIIDGVNVSGCGFRHKDTDNQCHIALAFSEDYGECWHCEQIENCYYKQLKRLEQENKELKISNSNLDNQLHRTIEMMNNCNNRLQQYRSALKEIRDYCEKCKKCVETGDEVILYTVIKKVDEVLNEQ